MVSDAWLSSRLRPRIQQGPVAGPSTKVGPVGGAARRGALRLMRPYTAYQETVNAEVLRSLNTISDEVDDRLEDLSERLVRANAMILGQLRSYDGIKALPAVIEAQSRAVDSVNGTLTEFGWSRQSPRSCLPGRARAGNRSHSLHGPGTLV